MILNSTIHHLGCLLLGRNPIYLFTYNSPLEKQYLLCTSNRGQRTSVPRDRVKAGGDSLQGPECGQAAAANHRGPALCFLL